MMRPALEVAEVFRRHGEAFRRGHDADLGRVERRVMAAIEACRTQALGGHAEQCGDCGLVRLAYTSCRNPGTLSRVARSPQARTAATRELSRAPSPPHRSRPRRLPGLRRPDARTRGAG